MKFLTYDRVHNRFAPDQRSPFALITIILALIAALSLAGCVGLTGAGTPAANSDTSGTLAASATSVSFGGVKIGTKSSQTVTLTNTGKAGVTITQASITGTGFSLVGGMSSISVPAGQQRTVQVQFAPMAPGNVSGNVAVASDASDGSLAISLSGTGTSDLAITTQPANQSVVSGQMATFSVVVTGSGTLTYQWQKNGAAISGATAASYTTPATANSDNGALFTVVATDSTGSVTSNSAALTVTAAPIAPSITSQPANQAVTVGQTATFSVTATGTATLTYQWKKNGTAVSGATASSYTTPATSATDSGSLFTVTVTNSTGNVTSNAATLTVNVPPSITTQPSNQTVNAGQTATFSVTATGSGTLTYQWSKSGTIISGATASSYTTPTAAAADNGALFTVVVTGASSSVTSNAAMLTVNALPAISTQPVNQTVTAGQTASFSVAATGAPTPTYQWKKNGTAISGATSTSYTTPATASTDNGALFTVTVTNSTGSITSNAATLTVTVPPTITAQPANQTVTSGQTATFSVAATGTGTLTYQWKKNGNAIAGAASASYTTPATATTDNGALFTVTVTGTAGTVTSNSATLTVTAAPVAPSITLQPANQSVNAGQAAAFSVIATGTATLTYQWNKNGTPISGATSASYTTPVTAASDTGTAFTVTITNSIGSVTSNSALLTVNVPPTITAQPANQTVTGGQTATFSVTATGTGTLTYQWSKNGAAISGAASVSYTTPATAATDNGALFNVIVTSTSGSVTSSAATLTVNVLPSITTQPASQTVTTGQTATFSVTATGTAPITYQWSKNGAAISGATSASYTTPATTSSDSGAKFTVTLTNIAGNITSNAATLTVNAATLLLNASRTSLSFSNVNLGGTASLPVTFTNAGNSNITISNVSISGAGLTANGVSSGQIVTPGNTVTLTVTFAPAAAGSVTGASVTVTSNATNSPTTISLSGTGVQTLAPSVTLSWAASASTVSGYNVYRSTVSGGPYTKLNSAVVAATTYTDSTVQAGQTYFYVVTSVDPTGVESAYSAQVSVTIP